MTFASTIPWMLQYRKRYKSHEEILDHFENNVVLSSSSVTPQFPLPTPKTLGESQTGGGICLPPYHTTCSSQSTNSCPLSKQKSNTNNLCAAVHNDDSLPDSSLDVDPVNILCIDGGGMKGYAMMTMVEIIEEKCKERGSSFFDSLHLIAGTSAGGTIALMLGRHKKTPSIALREMRHLFEQVRTKTFGSLRRSKHKLWEIARKGKIVGHSDSPEAIFNNLDGMITKNTILLDLSAIPTCVMCSSQVVGDVSIKPFILRSYNYPQQHTEKTSKSSSRDVTRIIRSTSSVSIGDAAAGTSAVPGLVAPVKIEIDHGEQIFLADGGLFCNSPVAIALNEAMKLYPNRPIGVVLSIGCNIDEETFANRAIEITKKQYPSLHYHRIAPSQILDKYSPLEVDEKRIALMEEDVRRYMSENELELLEETIGRMCGSDNVHNETMSKETLTETIDNEESERSPTFWVHLFKQISFFCCRRRHTRDAMKKIKKAKHHSIAGKDKETESDCDQSTLSIMLEESFSPESFEDSLFSFNSICK